MDKIFNLVDNPWILVRDMDENVQEVSIRELFINAQNYRELAGETPTQDFAVLRLLLAISVICMTRWNEDGEFEPLEDEGQALDRWEYLWEQGKYDEKVISEYLDEVRESFWLIAPEKRFLQHPLAQEGTANSVAKMVGDIAESANKPRLFQSRNGEMKEKLAPDAAARWLINLNGYDDTAFKPGPTYKAEVKAGIREKAESPGAGWLGKIGAIYAKGASLFETLMLNSVLLKDGKTLWSSCIPLWERKDDRVFERIQIDTPDDFCALLTIPSRRLWLKEDERGMIEGLNLIGGEFFPRTNATAEQFTLWRNADPKKKKMNEFTPKRHQPSRQLWRDFQAITQPTTESKTLEPGIIQWLQVLEEEEILPYDMPIEFVAPYVVYGDKDFFITDISSQSMILYPKLLSEGSAQYREMIVAEIDKIDQVARSAGVFSKLAAMSLGSSGELALQDYTKGAEEIYKSMGTPFSEWLSTIDPSKYSALDQSFYDKVEQWHKEAREIALRFSDSVVANTPISGLFGRTIKQNKKQDKNQEKEEHISIPEAEIMFRRSVNKIYRAAADAQQHSSQ